MKRASLFIMLSGSMLLAQQQTPVEITAEPHHRLLLENDNVRVFAVTIPPREATELARHEHNFLVVTFQDSEIASWAEGEAGVLTYRFRTNDIHFYFGGVAWIPSEKAEKPTTKGTQPARFVVVELQ